MLEARINTDVMLTCPLNSVQLPLRFTVAGRKGILDGRAVTQRGADHSKAAQSPSGVGQGTVEWYASAHPKTTAKLLRRESEGRQ